MAATRHGPSAGSTSARTHVCWQMPLCDETGESWGLVMTIVLWAAKLVWLSLFVMVLVLPAFPVCSSKHAGLLQLFGQVARHVVVDAHHAPTSLCLAPERTARCRERYCLTWIRPCQFVTAMYVPCHRVKTAISVHELSRLTRSGCHR